MAMRPCKRCNENTWDFKTQKTETKRWVQAICQNCGEGVNFGHKLISGIILATPEDSVRIYTDGATVGHNGKLGTVTKVGLGVWIPALNQSYYKQVNGLSNNEAEFKALIYGMELAKTLGLKRVTFCCDSQVIINRALGITRPTKAKRKNERMDEFQDTVFQLKKSFEQTLFKWIPRGQNVKADQLSKMAAV